MAEIEPITPVQASKPIDVVGQNEKPMDILDPKAFWAQISLKQVVNWLMDQVKSDNARMQEANEQLKKVAEGQN